MEIEIDAAGTLKGLELNSKAVEQGIKDGIAKAALYLEAKMVEKVSNGNIPPPLKEATIKAKGSSATLIDTGELLGQITTSFGVKEKGLSASVGVQGSRAEIASYHEFGVPYKSGEIIPERSFIRSTFNTEKGKVEGIIKDEIKKAIKT